MRVGSSEIGVRRSEIGVRRSEFGVRRSEFGDRSSEFGDRSSEIGVRRSEFGDRSSEIGDRSWGGAVRRCVSGPEQTAASGRNRNLDPNAIHSFRESGEGITITITFKSERNDHYRSIVCPAACVLCTAVPRNLPSRRRISEGRSHARRRGPVGEPCQSWIRDARRSSLRPSVAAQPDCLSVVQFGPVTVIEGDSPQRRREHREDRS